jgi:hypothetical protein
VIFACRLKVVENLLTDFIGLRSRKYVGACFCIPYCDQDTIVLIIFDIKHRIFLSISVSNPPYFEDSTLGMALPFISRIIK